MAIDVSERRWSTSGETRAQNATATGLSWPLTSASIIANCPDRSAGITGQSRDMAERYAKQVNQRRF